MIKEERRRHHRVPIISELVEPVLVRVSPSELDEEIPGIMMNLSAGGMVVITFLSLPWGALIDLIINLPGLKIGNVKGRVVRVEEKGGTYLVGISFASLEKGAKDSINRMAKDFNNCKKRHLKGEKNICFKKCAYYPLCSQSIKGHMKKHNS